MRRGALPYRTDADGQLARGADLITIHGGQKLLAATHAGILVGTEHGSMSIGEPPLTKETRSRAALCVCDTGHF